MKRGWILAHSQQVMLTCFLTKAINQQQIRRYPSPLKLSCRAGRNDKRNAYVILLWSKPERDSVEHRVAIVIKHDSAFVRTEREWQAARHHLGTALDGDTGDGAQTGDDVLLLKPIPQERTSDAHYCVNLFIHPEAGNPQDIDVGNSCVDHAALVEQAVIQHSCVKFFLKHFSEFVVISGYSFESCWCTLFSALV